MELAGDQLRITERIAVETAKRIFTETDIATAQCFGQCTGVESLQRIGTCHQTLQILMIGAGQTNANIARFLAKEGIPPVHVLNRTRA